MALTILLGFGALAVEPDEILADAALEARARDISSNLRCLVCQNQSIDDSDAELAADLRVLVRERLLAGDSNAEVTQYVVDRYGEFVLLRPVLGLHTLVLWIAAPMILLVGFLAIVLRFKRKPTGATSADEETSAGEEAGMNDAERAVLASLMESEEHGEHQD